jgi:hypothetical protein
MLEPRELLTYYFDSSALFATNGSGGSRSAANAVASDSDGNTYITGDFSGSSVDFDPAGGVSLGVSAGGTDIFITKFDPDGNLVWNVLIGGTGDDAGLAIAANEFGAVYIAGFFSATVDFDPGAATQNRTSNGGKDGFVLRLNSNTGAFLHLNAFGSTGEDQATGLDIFHTNSVVTTGFFNGTVDFNPSATVTNAVSAGGDDIFLLDSAEDLQLRNVFRMGGTGADRGAAIEITSERDFLLTGSFSGTGNFNPRAGAVNLVSSGGTDAFTARYDGGIFLKWAAKAGGTGNDSGTDIDFDPSGRVVTTGNFNGTVDFDPSAATAELISRGGTDGFLATYDSFGGLRSVEQIGGRNDDAIRGLDIDPDGNRFVTGQFFNLIRFGRGNGEFPLDSSGAENVFIAKLTPDDRFLYSQQLRSATVASAGGLTLGSDSKLIIAGNARGPTDFDPNQRVQLGNLPTQSASAFVVQLQADLSLSTGSQIATIRRNGPFVEIHETQSASAPESSFLSERGPLSETRSVSVKKTGNQTPATMRVDFESGGGFTLPGGVQFSGSTVNGVINTVEVIGTGVEGVTVRPSATTHKSGTVLAHNMTTSLTNIDRVVTIRSQALLIETPNSGSVLTITADPGPGGADGTRVEGTSGGVQMLHTVFSGVPSVTVSTERLAETSAAAADTMTLAAAALQAAGLKNLYLRTGRGNDNLIVNGPDIGLPASGGAFWYLGGSGVDRLTAVGDTNFDLNDSRLVSGGGGRIQIDDIEKASLTGGALNNHLNAALFTGDVILDGAAGADLLRGGSGNDTVFGGTGNDRIYGNEGDDVLNGQDNNDQLFGGNGSDTLNGLSGNDRLYGEEDDDFLNGGANNDVLLGGNGNDTLFGGTEDDLLFGEAGDDILNGDAGNDQLDFGSGNDTGNGGAGNDLYLLYGTQNAEDLQLARNSATSATFRRKPRGLTSSLESKGITMDATDEFFIQALDGDDLIAIDAGFTQLGSVDGGNGSDTCTAPGAWTKVSC